MEKDPVYTTETTNQVFMVLNGPTGTVCLNIDHISAIAEAPPNHVTENKVLTHIWVKGRNDPYFILNNINEIIDFLGNL
jgi:hypothetical protein